MTHKTNAIVNTSRLINLGDAIRAKTGGTSDMTIDEMATAISGISGGGPVILANDAYKHTYKLSETNYPNLTFNNGTTKTLLTRPSSYIYEFYVPNNLTDDYIVQCKMAIDYKYASGTIVGPGMIVKGVAISDYIFAKYSSNLSNLESGTRNTVNLSGDSIHRGAISYYNSSSTLTSNYYKTSAGSSMHGIKFNESNAPYATTTGSQGTLYKICTPQIDVYPHATYSDASFISSLDQDLTTIALSVSIYKWENGIMNLTHQAINDLWTNGVI